MNITVWVPDKLADEARAAGLNLSRAASDGLRSALGHPELFTGTASAGKPDGTPHEHHGVTDSAECRVCGRTIIPEWVHLTPIDGHTPDPVLGGGR